MGLQEIMAEDRFVVAGDTLNEEKYAFRIKHALLEHGYQVQCVGKELSSLNDIQGELGIIDLCIHPAKGIGLLRECRKPCRGVLIQPGAESQEIFDYLKEQGIPYLRVAPWWDCGCILKKRKRKDKIRYKRGGK